MYETFINWVAANDQEAYEVMADFADDVNPEILDLYRINTERFVEWYSQ